MSTYETIREKIIQALRKSNRPLTVDDLIMILELNPSMKNQLYNHIMHAAKSLRAKTRGREEIVMIPPRCIKCGYTFIKLKRVKKPSKCPKCKSERIEPPSFMIRQT
ncbi:MAG: transcriptional regulator [archaeon GB-1867-035]|nr:transcriptional regulator [Candidatus Culexmicrobium profundum]